MKFLKYNSDKIVNVNISRYLIDWSRKVSGPQLLVKQFLFKYWKSHIVLEEFFIPGSPRYRLDLMSLTSKVIIEVSPRKVHNEYNKFFHKGRGGYLKKMTSDMNKLLWSERAGYRYIELYDEDLKNLSKQYLKEKFDLDL